MSFKKGFTLIELMIVVSLTGVVFVTNAVKYNNYKRTEIVKQAALTLENNLTMVRNKALAGEKLCGASGCGGDADTCFGSEPLSGWSVTFNPDTNCWGRNGQCDSECDADSAVSQDVYASCARGGVCAGSCWSSNGIGCDSECRYANTALATVYPNCNSSLCAAGMDCWGVDLKCDSGCTVNSVNSVAVYSNCTSEDCGVYQWKYGNEDCTQTSYRELWSEKHCTGTMLGLTWSYHGGNCLQDGLGKCYAIVNPGGYVYHKSTKEDGKCTNTGWGSQLYDFFPCTWTCVSSCGQNRYQVSGSIWKVEASGSCNSGGTGYCYKPINGSTYFSGGADCGASSCPSGIYYDDYRQCGWLSALYSYSVGGSATQAYQGGGGCNAGGTGACYKLTGGGTYYTGGAPCGSSNCAGAANYFQSSQTCSFLTALYRYTASDQVTKLAGGGFCSSDGSGDCYKMLNPANYYTGNGPCGSNCPVDTFYDSSLRCEFYGEIGVATYQIRGVCGGNVFNFKNFQLPAGVAISHSPEKIVFQPTPLSGVNEPGDICVSGFGKHYKITITSAGLIEDVGFVTTCPI